MPCALGDGRAAFTNRLSISPLCGKKARTPLWKKSPNETSKFSGETQVATRSKRRKLIACSLRSASRDLAQVALWFCKRCAAACTLVVPTCSPCSLPGALPACQRRSRLLHCSQVVLGYDGCPAAIIDPWKLCEVLRGPVETHALSPLSHAAPQNRRQASQLWPIVRCARFRCKLARRRHVESVREAREARHILRHRGGRQRQEVGPLGERPT